MILKKSLSKTSCPNLARKSISFVADAVGALPRLPSPSGTLMAQLLWLVVAFD